MISLADAIRQRLANGLDVGLYPVTKPINIMTIEQKIKEIEDVLVGFKHCPEIFNSDEDGYSYLKQALEVIGEQQAQLERVRDTEKLKALLFANTESANEGDNFFQDDEAPQIIEELQNYILGGEGGKLDNK